MTQYEKLQNKADDLVQKAQALREMGEIDLAKFCYNASKGYETKLAELVIEEAMQ